jgi:protein required for attachment to host cells
MKNWLVVANSSQARVLEPSATAGEYTPLADLAHPQSRMKGVELGEDRPGRAEGNVHVQGGGVHGPGGGEYEPRLDVREREHERFAQEVAAVVNAGVAGGRCAGLVLVVSNPFLGHLKAKLSEQAVKAVLRTLPRDYTALSDADLAARLKEAGTVLHHIGRQGG